MDYRKLLKNYMNQVGWCEGVYFIGKSEYLSEKDVSELTKIAEEIKMDNEAAIQKRSN